MRQNIERNYVVAIMMFLVFDEARKTLGITSQVLVFN